MTMEGMAPEDILRMEQEAKMGEEMDKEAVEKIAQSLDTVGEILADKHLDSMTREALAQLTLRELEKLGYHKLPNKPPLLSEGDFPKKGKPDFVFPQCCIVLERIAFAEGAKAQLRVCVKHYEG